MIAATNMLREIGISDPAIRQVLTDYEVSAAEHAMTAKWKADHMRSQEWTAKFLAGDGDAVRDMTNANIVLSSRIKPAAA
jgi:hypothetical protein